MERVEGEQYKADSETSSAFHWDITLLPAWLIPENCIAVAFLKWVTWFMNSLSHFLSLLLFYECCKNMRKPVTEASGGLVPPLNQCYY